MRVLALCALSMIGGCQYIGVESSQLDAIIDVFYPKPELLPDVLWGVQYAGYSAVVNPILINSTTAFVNNNGDAIFFDGWLITQVSGLDNFMPAWEIQDSGSERAFSLNGQVVATHQCSSWSEVGTDKGVRFEQHCRAKNVYINKILVNKMGQITNIEQVVDSSLMVLRLQLNN